MPGDPASVFSAYPAKPCADCDLVLGDHELIATYFYRPSLSSTSPGPRVMLIGQDPTIADDPDRDRVTHALMLNDPNSVLSRWLRGEVFAETLFDSFELYATNAVKCTFPSLPSSAKGGAERFLRPYFNNCRRYLRKEILEVRPERVFTFGEAAHQLLMGLLDTPHSFRGKMKVDFDSQLRPVSISGWKFLYTPCLHIKQYRTARTYGPRIVEWLRTMNP